jgi:hypothetical protein
VLSACPPPKVRALSRRSSNAAQKAQSCNQKKNEIIGTKRHLLGADFVEESSVGQGEIIDSGERAGTALIEAAKDPTYSAEIVLVVSNRSDAGGLELRDSRLRERAAEKSALPDGKAVPT